MSVDDQTLDLLAHKRFPHLAAAVRARAGEIVRRWEDAVRETLPAADELTLAELRNSLPLILDEIADALASDKPAATERLVQGSRGHGESRFHDNYNVRELVVEYRLLRRVVIEQVHAEIPVPLDADQNVALNMALDTAIQSGIVVFTEHQRDQIRAASEAQSKYLSFLSHDLRNHLNHATLILQLLGERLAEVPGCDDAVQDVHSIQQSIFQTTDGMDRLLHAERLRKGAYKPALATFALDGVFAELLKSAGPATQAKGLHVQVEVPQGAAIHSDRGLILLVLQNLLGNAIKYSSRGTIRLVAEPPAIDRGWTLSVSDQGPGIAPEKVDRLFDAFTRGETHGQSGVGLGLSIASQAAKVLGGHLALDSTPNAGSTFRLVLPPHNRAE